MNESEKKVSRVLGNEDYYIYQTDTISIFNCMQFWRVTKTKCDY
jgi:hypothetical protein